MKLKLFLNALLFIVFSSNVLSQNVLRVESKEVSASTEFELVISLDNTDEIAAVQFDVNYDSAEFNMQTGHDLTNRKAGHSLGVNSPSEGVLRVVIYSSSNSVFTGNSGSLVNLKFKSKNNPGEFNFKLSNVVFSSSSGAAIASTKIDGLIKVLTPKMEVLTSQVNFGNVLLGSNNTRSLLIRNSGNLPLIITNVNAVLPFSIENSFPISISANSTKYLTVSLDASTKFNGSKELSFVNNDIDIVRNAQKSNLSAVVSATNTVNIGNGSGEINTEVVIPVSVENMEEFTAFQFDLLIPEGLEFVPNSIINSSSRLDDHSIAVSIINGNVLRFIGYSPSNKNFIGNSGELFNFKLKPIVSSGYFSLNVSNAILTNIAQENILSSSSNGYLQINSPNLSIDPSTINYNSVSITETKNTVLKLTNYGSAQLNINDIVFNNSELSLDTTIPIIIDAGESKNVNLTFTPTNSGIFSETIAFRHNAADEQTFLKISATKFSPNYLTIIDANVKYKIENELQLKLNNNDAVKAVQFDVELPSDFNLITDKVEVLDRASGFNVAVSNLNNNVYRVILYSLSNIILTKGNQAILKLPITINDGVNLGNYKLNFTNVIISDVNNKDVSSIALEEGTMTLTDESLSIDDETILKLKLFPNPTFNNLKITSSFEIHKIELFTINGKKIKLKDNLNNINVAHLPPGLYFLKIYSEQKIIKRSFIKM